MEKVKVRFNKSGKTKEMTRKEFDKTRQIVSVEIVEVVKAKPPISKAVPVEKVPTTPPKAEFVTDATAPGILDYTKD